MVTRMAMRVYPVRVDTLRRRSRATMLTRLEYPHDFGPDEFAGG
jgi:hypothetical protein